MKTRGRIDFYLPRKVAYHLKIVLGGIFIAMFFSLIWTGKLINENFWHMFASSAFQLEIFMLIAVRIFRKKYSKSDRSYKSQIVARLIKFYLLVLLIGFLIVIITLSVGMLFGNQSFAELVQHFIRNELRAMLISWLIGISLGSLFFFYAEWNNALKREQKLREEKLIFRYETLKNQVNPHFLFNSLNTLSSLVSEDPKLSEKFISNLSNIYRYILENRDVELINLTNEIAFVERFFFLQKIRDNGKIDLQTDVPEAEKYEILPISIQLLIENALKHNAATMQKPLVIKLKIKDGFVVVENTLQPKMQLQPSSKLGLKNLKERVKLILNKDVIIEKSNGLFTVKIPLKPIK